MDHIDDGRTYTDEDGKQWQAENGKPILDGGQMVPKMQATKTHVNSGFTTFDTSQGHCAMCGRLTCNGGCFKG